MLKIVMIIFTLLALSVCHSNTSSQNADKEPPNSAGSHELTEDGNQQKIEVSPTPIDPSDIMPKREPIPDKCLAWYDGCNNCKRVRSGENIACTLRACAIYEKFVCHSWAE